MKTGGRTAEFIIETCIKRVGIAFDGKAWTIIVLADVHGDELFGAIGNKFARGFGGLVVGEVPPLWTGCAPEESGGTLLRAT